jgi:hypothetical protein
MTPLFLFSYSYTHLKIIFVTGGVLSGIGKGIAAASIGILSKIRRISQCRPRYDESDSTWRGIRHRRWG